MIILGVIAHPHVPERVLKDQGHSSYPDRNFRRIWICLSDDREWHADQVLVW